MVVVNRWMLLFDGQRAAQPRRLVTVFSSHAAIIPYANREIMDEYPPVGEALEWKCSHRFTAFNPIVLFIVVQFMEC